MLCKLLASQHFVLRRSAVSCLRQFAQREAAEICGYASTLDFSEAEEMSTTPADDGVDNESLVIIRLNYQSGKAHFGWSFFRQLFASFVCRTAWNVVLPSGPRNGSKTCL